MKILVLRLSSIGDIILTQPVPRALKKKFPDAQIDFLTKPSYRGIVEAFDCIDNIYEWEDKKTAIKIIRKNKYDLIIDLHSKLNTLIIKFLSGTKKLVTVNKRHWYRWALTKKLIKQPNQSMSSLFLKTLTKIGIESDDFVPALFPKEVLKSVIYKLYTDNGIDRNKKLVGIFPSALHYTKRYSTIELARFINLVPDKYKCQFLILGSKQDDQYADKIIERTGVRVHNLCGKVNIPELIALVDTLDFVISNDSGPMHIAAALKKPQIAIFGGTHPQLGFAPLNVNAAVLNTDLPCQPCSIYGLDKCPLGTMDCMKAITADHLLSAFEELIV